MNNAFPVLIIIHLALTCAAVPEVRADSLSEAELIALDDAWIDAEVSGDMEALERILDEQFLATWASGKTMDRSEYIDYILSKELSPFSVVRDSIRVHGDTAVVIDVSETGKTKFTWIAVKRDGQWRVISETFSRVESP